MSGHFDEAFVQRQVMPDGVLPSLLVLLIKRVVLHDVLVDTIQGEATLRTILDRHHDQGVVTEGRFFVLLLLLVRFVLLSFALFLRRISRFLDGVVAGASLAVLRHGRAIQRRRHVRVSGDVQVFVVLLFRFVLGRVVLVVVVGFAAVVGLLVAELVPGPGRVAAVVAERGDAADVDTLVLRTAAGHVRIRQRERHLRDTLRGRRRRRALTLGVLKRTRGGRQQRTYEKRRRRLSGGCQRHTGFFVEGVRRVHHCHEKFSDNRGWAKAKFRKN